MKNHSSEEIRKIFSGGKKNFSAERERREPKSLKNDFVHYFVHYFVLYFFFIYQLIDTK